MISAQWTTNRWGTKYRYYRCSKKRGRCSQQYIQETELARQIKAQLQTISLCERYTDWMMNKVKTWEHEETTASQSEVQNLSAQVKMAEARMEKLVSTYLDGDIPKPIYLTKKDETLRASATLKDKMKDFERGRKNWVEPLKEWILDTKQADFLAKLDDLHEIKGLVQKIGTNPLVRNKSAHFSFSAPSQFVAKQKGFLQNLSSQMSSPLTLSEAEVPICGEGGIGHPLLREWAPTAGNVRLRRHSMASAKCSGHPAEPREPYGLRVRIYFIAKHTGPKLGPCVLGGPSVTRFEPTSKGISIFYRKIEQDCRDDWKYFFEWN